MRPLFIFDLDGTLALTEHRQHLVAGETKDWRAFFAACVHDQPNLPVIRTMQALQQAGAECWVWSGRSTEVQRETSLWFQTHGVTPAWLRMRQEGDFTPDEALKAQWLADLREEDRARLVAIFDDRDKVVRRWRELGVACFQVAPGEF